MRDEIKALLERTGPLMSPEIARRLGISASAARDLLGALYTHREVDRDYAADGHTWLWRSPRTVRIVASEPITAAPEALPRTEEDRVAVRVRRMLAARRGQPEPMSGTPRKG